MSRWKQRAGTVALALVLATPWVQGCGGDVTADDLRATGGGQSQDEPAPGGDSRLAQDDAREGSRYSEASRDSEARSDPGPSFFDRLMGERTREVTVPSGTVLSLRFSETLSSRDSSAGDVFRTTVEEDVRLTDAVAIPAGSVIVGRVTEAHQPQKVGGRARLTLEFTELELPSGDSVPIEASFADRGKSENLKDAGIIAGSTIGGVVLGEAVDEGEGGIIGGILGGIGGAVAASKTHGKPVEVAGTVMAVELARAVTLEIPA